MHECCPAFQGTSWYDMYQCSENISFYSQLFEIESALVLSSNIMLHTLVPVSNRHVLQRAFCLWQCKLVLSHVSLSLNAPCSCIAF